MPRLRFVGLALILVTLLVYLPVRRHAFVLYDDPEYLTANRTVQAGLTLNGVGWAFTTWHASNWHPLTWLSHMLDCELFGLDAGAHHLVNVVFHAANGLLLLALLFRMTGALWPSALAAALFAWHPLRVESVAWAAERKDVLSTFFGLLALLMYARFAEARKLREPHTRDARRSYALALACFALALLSKPMLVTLPFVLLLLDYWPLQRLPVSSARELLASLRGLTVEKLPFFALSAASCVVTFLAQRTEAVVALEPYPLGLRCANALVSYGRYLFQACWPANLAVFYPLPRHVPVTHLAAATALLAALSWLAWRSRRRAPHLLAGWLWFLGTLVPVLGLVQVGGQACADRYTYLPLAGILIAVAFEARHWVARFQLKPLGPALAAGVVLAGCLVATGHQLRFWEDSEKLFARAVAVTADNPVAHINLGVALEQQGRTPEALHEYQTAVRLAPDRAQAQNNLANLLDQLGQSDEALRHYREAVRLKPTAPLAHLNLGTLLLKLGQSDEAWREYTEAARLAPTDPRPLYLMGKARLRQGRSAEAVASFRDALLRDPNDFQTLTYLARVLAADLDPRVRDGTEALALAARANALTGGQQPYVLDTLAMACAEAGRFEEARRWLLQAIELATAAGEPEAVSAMQERQRLYSAGQPYREVFTNSPARR